MIGFLDSAADARSIAAGLRARLAKPWDVFAESLERYEVHLSDNRLEMVRGPIRLAGVGIRLFRPRVDGLGEGFASTTDLTEEGVQATLDAAEQAAAHGHSPASRVDLPPPVTGGLPVAETVDRRLAEDPLGRSVEYARSLLEAYVDSPGTRLSFGSVRVTVGETTIGNSEGLEVRFPHTHVFREVGVKSFGGPEGRPPGEFWLSQTARTLDPDALEAEVDLWNQRAAEARRAESPTAGPSRVVLAPGALADFATAILGFRFSGAAELRKVSPPTGAAIASEKVSIHDDGLYPFGLGSAPTDDEGIPHTRKTLVRRGVAMRTLQDTVHASALGTTSTGNGRRDNSEYFPWRRFDLSPTPQESTMVIDSGEGGTDPELAEVAGDGLWIEQIGFPLPEPFSGTFGGEIRLGYRIRNGKIAEPVRGGTVGGVLLSGAEQPSLLRSVAEVGGRTSLVGYLATPPILFENMPVGGQA